MNFIDYFLPEYAQRLRDDPVNKAIDELRQYYWHGRLSYMEYYLQVFRLKQYGIESSEEECTCANPFDTCPACRATARRVYGGEG